MTTPGDHLLTVTSSRDGTAQPYRLFVPQAIERGEPLPFVVVLHGRGVDHNAWFDLTPVKEIAERYGYIVAAERARGPAYYNGAGEQDVLDIIAAVGAMLPVDSRRVYLAGHSMGGWGTWYIGLRHPELFGSIAPMAAPLPPAGEVSFENARTLCPYIIHDAGDEIVPVAKSRKAAETLRGLGISFEYREETGYGHASRMIGDNLPRVLEWFNGHPQKQMMNAE